MAQNAVSCISKAVQVQRNFFAEGKTIPTAFRKQQLELLYKAVLKYSDEIGAALNDDLGKSPYESYATETGLVLSEIRFLIKHVAGWNRGQHVPTALFNFPGWSTVYQEPYGVALIMSPWNYPFMLTMIPLAAAISAGNCAVIKPSRYSVHTSDLIVTIIREVFKPEYVCAFEGGHEINTALLDEKFDFIFFTGSVAVGKTVMHAAAEHLTPLCLELGGKSPCIVDSSADIRLAARRIVWGKMLNAGQTCVAPDYVLADKSVIDILLSEMLKQVGIQYGSDPLHNPDFPKIINEKHFNRLRTMVPEALYDEKQNKIAPTILPLTLEEAGKSPVMQEEIFGPILPVIGYDSSDQAKDFIRQRPVPLALYIFSRKRKIEKDFIRTLRFGGGCINDTVMHIASSRMPFGGMEESGMGNYHGKSGFDTFTHKKSILRKGSFDPSLRYAPYGQNLDMLKKLEH